MTIKTAFTLIKVTILTVVVLLAFIYSSLGWQHYVTEGSTRILVGAIILIMMYTLMVLELVNRTLAALIGAAVSVAAYDCLIEYVEMEEIIQWQDLETLTLLLGMMIIVAILSSSGVFDFLAVWSYKQANGNFWLLVSIMSLVGAFLSAFLDNVSNMLLLSPTLIKLSELEHIDARYMLMILVIVSNLGGAATPVGDPPNLIIIGDELTKSLGITFGSFVAYCAPCVLITTIFYILYLRSRYKSKESFRRWASSDLSTPSEYGAQENSREFVSVGNCQSVGTKQNQLELLGEFKQRLVEIAGPNVLLAQIDQQISSLKSRNQQVTATLQSTPIADVSPTKDNSLAITLNSYMGTERRSSRLDAANIEKLIVEHSIKSKVVLVQALLVLVIVVALFFIQSLPNIRLTLGWTSLFGALILLVMSTSIKLPSSKAQSNGDGDGGEHGGHEQEGEQQEDNFERIVQAIEWSTLMFFFGLFIVMRVMTALGVIRFLGMQIVSIVDALPEGNWQAIGAITIVLWASAVASACINNVPFTSMMIKVLGTMIVHEETRMSPMSTTLAIKPLVFALALGACYGGNGTLIGASVNLVTAGIAQRHGYPITFARFFKFAAPAALISLIIANLYLVVVFVVLDL